MGDAYDGLTPVDPNEDWLTAYFVGAYFARIWCLTPYKSSDPTSACDPHSFKIMTQGHFIDYGGGVISPPTAPGGHYGWLFDGRHIDATWLLTGYGVRSMVDTAASCTEQGTNGDGTLQGELIAHGVAYSSGDVENSGLYLPCGCCAYIKPRNFLEDGGTYNYPPSSTSDIEWDDDHFVVPGQSTIIGGSVFEMTNLGFSFSSNYGIGVPWVPGG